MKIRLLAAALMAVPAAFWASQLPDGLDKTAEVLGFAGRGQAHSAWLSGYYFHFLGNSGWSAACAGIAGVFLVYGLFWLAGFLFGKSDGNARSE